MSIEKVERVSDAPAPDKCPACGAKRTDAEDSIEYECGYWFGYFKTCTRSFSAAVALRSELAQAQAERVNFNLVYAKKEDVTFYCVYCNKDFVMPDPESVREHTAVCDKHPMRQLKAANATLRTRLERVKALSETLRKDATSFMAYYPSCDEIADEIDAALTGAESGDEK